MKNKSYNNIHIIIKTIKNKIKHTQKREEKKSKSYLNLIASEAEKRKEDIHVRGGEERRKKRS
jgi:hypothetical protein